MATVTMPRVKRPTLEEMDLNLGKRTHLYRLLYEHGPGNGTLMFLPIDQGLEHGPRDFFVNPDALDPEFQCRLAADAGYSGIVFQVGVAQKYMRNYAGRVPLVLKLNGKTEIPSDAEALSPLHASVEDACRLGADAVGYTLYVGSPAQVEDFRQWEEVRREAETLGMPTIIWAYPRGEAIQQKGGHESLYAVDYAARVTCELGADVVKLNEPDTRPEVLAKCPKPYNDLEISHEEGCRKVVLSAGRTLVLFSGGSKLSDEDLFRKARVCMEAGATGLIFGRNMWQRKMGDALEMSRRIREMMLEF